MPLLRRVRWIAATSTNSIDAMRIRSWLSVVIVFLITLTTTAIAQTAAPLVAGTVLETRVYDRGDRVIASVPYPAAANALDQYQSTAGYARIVATFSGDQIDFVSPSDHLEFASDTRMKLVIWTSFNLGRIATVIMQASQMYMANAIGLLRGGQAASGIPLSLTSMDIPASMRSIEIEIFSVGPQIMSQPLPCQRKGAPKIDGLLPCPTLMLTDSTAIPQMASNGILMSLNDFLTGNTFVSDIFRGSETLYVSDGQWVLLIIIDDISLLQYALPAISDVRMLAFNRTTFTQLNLRMPPPFADWGLNNKDWTWAAMVDTAKRIKAAGHAEGFRLQADWNEEVRYMFIIEQMLTNF
jgi:hypothetical protein